MSTTMANISAAQVKELRDKTGAPMMDCKQALTDAKGNLEKRTVMRFDPRIAPVKVAVFLVILAIAARSCTVRTIGNNA